MTPSSRGRARKASTAAGSVLVGDATCAAEAKDGGVAHGRSDVAGGAGAGVDADATSVIHQCTGDYSCCEAAASDDGAVLRIRQNWGEDGRGGTDLGFGSAAFPAAVALALYLENPLHGPAAEREGAARACGCTYVSGRTVLELGCGVGLTSMAAAALGALAVVATDGDDGVLELTRDNVTRNAAGWNRGRTEGSALDATVTPLRVAKLLWGAGAADVLHRELQRHHGVDLVLAADVAALPYADAFDDLVYSLAAAADVRRAAQHASARGGAEVLPPTEVLLAYRMRHTAVEKKFFHKLKR